MVNGSSCSGSGIEMGKERCQTCFNLIAYCTCVPADTPQSRHPSARHLHAVPEVPRDLDDTADITVSSADQPEQEDQQDDRDDADDQ